MNMKERKTPSALKRVLANCSMQVKDYGSCIAQKIPEIERDMCLKEFLALKACMKIMEVNMSVQALCDQPGVGLASNGALSHVFLQHPPLQFKIPGSRGVYYDEGNKMLLSVTLNQVFCWKTSPSSSFNTDPTCDSINEGPVQFIQYSLDGKIIGIQRSGYEIEFRNRENGLTFSHRCRSENESILGFFWTECPTCDIVVIKTSGLDLFWYEPDLKALSLVETKRINVSWYVYTHESRLVLLAFGMQCKTFSGFQFSSGGVIRLPKFEMTMAKAEANTKPVLAEDDVHIVTIYGRIYCVQVDCVAMVAYFYRFYRDAVILQGSFPIYSKRIAVNVVDNVLLVHQIDSKVVIIYDIFLNTQTPISAPLPLILRSTSRANASFSQTQNVDAAGMSNEYIPYGDGWTFLVPDLICNVTHGTLWRIHLDLEAIAASSSEIPFILEFLQRRRLECQKAKQLCLAILRTIILERRPISMIYKSLNVLVSAYSQSLKISSPARLGADASRSETPAVSANETPCRSETRMKSIPQQYPSAPNNKPLNPGGSDEFCSTDAVEERLNYVSAGILDSGNIESSALQPESVEAGNNHMISNDIDQQNSQDSWAAISPDDMYHFVFAVVEEEMSADSYLLAVIIEYLRSSALEKLRVHPNLHAMTVQLLSRNERHTELDLFVTSKIIEPSKEVAFQLLESGRQNGHTRKLGLDMLRHLALHHNYLSVLVQDGYYLEALRYARKNKVETIQPSVYLNAAFTSNDPQQLAAVLRFLSDFIPSFRTTDDYATYSRILKEIS